MQRHTSPTGPATIYRFRAGLPLRDYLAFSDGMTIEFDDAVMMAEVQTHVVAGVRATDNPDWISHARQVTRRDLALAGSSPFLVIIVPIDERWVCAVTWGQGRYLLDDLMIDERFGLLFGIQRLDPTQLRTINSSLLDVSARATQTSFPAGSPLFGFGLEPVGELVTNVNGPADLYGLTYHLATDGRQCRIRAGKSLAIPIGRSPESFVADLRAICAIADESDAHSPLRSIAQIRPLGAHDPRVAVLDGRLALALGGDDQVGRLGLCWPTDAVNHVDEANSFATTGLGGRSPVELKLDLDVEAIAGHFRAMPAFERVRRLQNARLTPCADELGQTPLVTSTSLYKWIAFETTIDQGTYCLHQGRWYVLEQDAVARVRSEVADMLTNTSGLFFPKWLPSGKQNDEHDYCRLVARQPGYLCLDQNFARTPMHRKFELADIVGPQDEQVQIKWLARATALSHLITQARVSAWSQRLEPEALQQLDDKVRAIDSGRRITERPKTFVLAIAGRKWHVDELFTLSMVGLLKLRNELRLLGVDLQFADIPFAAKQKRPRADQAA